MFFRVQVKPEEIKKKRTVRGMNPRYTYACDQVREKRREYKELAHTVRRLTPAEIAHQYPPERIEQLLERARLNLQAMTGPMILSPFMDPEC